MKMKRIFLSILACMCLMATLVGCSKPKDNDSSSEPTKVDYSINESKPLEFKGTVFYDIVKKSNCPAASGEYYISNLSFGIDEYSEEIYDDCLSDNDILDMRYIGFADKDNDIDSVRLFLGSESDDVKCLVTNLAPLSCISKLERLGLKNMNLDMSSLNDVTASNIYFENCNVNKIKKYTGKNVSKLFFENMPEFTDEDLQLLVKNCCKDRTNKLTIDITDCPQITGEAVRDLKIAYPDVLDIDRND